MGKQTGTRIVLVRCGRTEWDDAGRLQGITDLPLSESGRTSLSATLAGAFGDEGWPELAAVYSGMDEASRQTAELLTARTNARQKPQPEFSGMSLGVWEGLLDEELMERFPTCYRHWREDPAAVHPPEGDTFAEATARLIEAIERAASKSRGKPIAIVLRPIEFGLARCLLSGRKTNELWAMIEDGPEVESVTLDPAALRERLEELKLAGRA